MSKLIYFSAITLMILSLSSCGVFFKYGTLSVENDSGQDIELTVDDVTNTVSDKAVKQVDVMWNNDKGNVHRHPFSFAYISNGLKITLSCYITMHNFETTHLEFTSIQGMAPVMPVDEDSNLISQCTNKVEY